MYIKILILKYISQYINVRTHIRAQRFFKATTSFRVINANKLYPLCNMFGEGFTTWHASKDRDTTDERPWRAPRRGRPNARPWRGPLPVYPPLVHRDRAAPVARDTRCGIPRGFRDSRPRNIPHCIHRNAPLWQLPQHALPDELA